ncbi:DUF4138 domain-containing protein [Cellulophaga baltica]|uniref:DUF4138 domain-containing protein n=1 Tax=Cellulophaga baltica TaxID=76594 RepID=UPI0024951B76|nr:DUF4138 domain-containing protein [Cellulophaga baltica]
MKTYIFILLIICSNSMLAQQSLDTIYANDKKNVALFFPKPIRQGITGATHFVFTYNREKEQYFGLLQAKPGIESNLLAVTNNGKVYSYILKYAEELPRLNYFILENESIGNEVPKVLPTIKEKKVTHLKKDKMDYFYRACTYVLNSKYKTLATIRKEGMQLQLQKMVYDGDEVYLAIEIKNTSEINFDVDYINIYVTNGNAKRKSSYQSLQQEVIYKHKMPKSVMKGLHQRFVYVLPKFVLGENERLEIELKELKGSRKVVLNSKL